MGAKGDELVTHRSLLFIEHLQCQGQRTGDFNLRACEHILRQRDGGCIARTRPRTSRTPGKKAMGPGGATNTSTESTLSALQRSTACTTAAPRANAVTKP